MRSRVAVLASGGGSNLQAILDHFARLGERRGGDVVLVASNRREAGALERAARSGITAAVLDAEPAEPTPDGAPELIHELALCKLLDRHAIDLIVLAGYLKLVPPEVVAQYRGRMINIHPALLPAFGGPGMYGQRVHRAVLDAGARVTGVTAHFVDDAYDRGRIIAQWPVPVFASDDTGTLAARVLRLEHMVFPRVVDAVAGGRTTLANCGSARGSAAESLVDTRPAFTLLPHEDSRLVENIELALGC